MDKRKSLNELNAHDQDLFIKLINQTHQNNYSKIIENSIKSNVSPTKTKDEKKANLEKNYITIKKRVFSSLLVISLTAGLISGAAIAKPEIITEPIISIGEGIETNRTIDKLIEMAQNNMERLNLGKWETDSLGNHKTFVLYQNTAEDFSEQLNIDSPLEAWIYWNAIINSKHNNNIINAYENSIYVYSNGKMQNINYYDYLKQEGFTLEKMPPLYDDSDTKFDPFENEMKNFIRKMIENESIDTFINSNFISKGGNHIL